MNKVFTDNGWNDYVYWQTEDRKPLKKINRLLDDISRNGNTGIGKPEPLVGICPGFGVGESMTRTDLCIRLMKTTFTC